VSISNRRAAAETVVIVIFFFSLLCVLSWHGVSRRVFALPSRIVAIQHPQEALAFWEKSKVRGRTLYLFDRLISADPLPEESGEFTTSEFSSLSDINSLCGALANDGLLPGNQDMPYGIEALNSIIRDRHFYDQWRRVKSVVPARNVRNLIRKVSRMRDSYSSLSVREKNKVTKLNRLLIESTYPLQCPQKKSFIPGENNYMTAAVRRGFVRRIYHVISDGAWPEVEKNLEQFPAVLRFDGVYRLRINEGVPVTIMRLRDIEPEHAPVLMQIDRSHWTEEQMRTISSLIASNTLPPDLVTVMAAGPNDLVTLERAL